MGHFRITLHTLRRLFWLMVTACLLDEIIIYTVLHMGIRVFQEMLPKMSKNPKITEYRSLVISNILFQICEMHSLK